MANKMPGASANLNETQQAPLKRPTGKDSAQIFERAPNPAIDQKCDRKTEQVGERGGERCAERATECATDRVGTRRFQQVQSRAYKLWEDAGKPTGETEQVRFWLEAEIQFDRE